MLLGLSACGKGDPNLPDSSSSSKDVYDKNDGSKQPEASGTGSVSDKDSDTSDTSDTTASSDTSKESSAESDSERIPGQFGSLDKDKEYKLLFIGNSYTYYNKMPEDIFRSIAVSAGYKVNVSSLTKGGWTLRKSADQNDELGQQVDSALKSNKYDFVIIQEQSLLPATEPAKFYDGVRSIYKKIKENGAKPYLYETWGRKKDHADLKEYGMTNATMTWKLAGAYTAIGKELGIDVSYAGLAFFDVYNSDLNSIELYNADSTHPSPAGSYLAALTLFADIFGYDPEAVGYRPTGIPETDAAILKKAAHDAAFNDVNIPKDYLMSSDGVTYREDLDIDYSKMKNLTEFPRSELISVISGGKYPNGKSFSGILGTKGQIASKEYSLTGLTDVQKAEIADIGYGVSVIGIEKMFEDSKGYATAVENLVNGHWGSSLMACFEFDSKKYDINGNVSNDGKYTGLITLNFGRRFTFDAIGFFSGNLKGFPGAAEVYVSDDGTNWKIVPTACWDQITGTALVSCAKSPADPWNGNQSNTSCLFDMEGVSGQYIRIGVAVGRNDKSSKYNTINTRELVVYGKEIKES